VGQDFSKASIAQKNKDRIAVNLRHAVASFWIDVRGQEVKAIGGVRSAVGDHFEVVGSMASGLELSYADSIVEYGARVA
jgi:hypothetical protein